MAKIQERLLGWPGHLNRIADRRLTEEQDQVSTDQADQEKHGDRK